MRVTPQSRPARSARPTRAQINQAQSVLSQLQERISSEEASSALNWFRVDMILESEALTPNTKFYALQILESAIKFRWKTLPAEQVCRPRPRGRAPTCALRRTRRAPLYTRPRPRRPHATPPRASHTRTHEPARTL